MQNMKGHLILAVFALAGIARAQGGSPAAQQVSDARAAGSVRTAAPPRQAAPHQLSAEQRAELRRQLYQFNRLQQGKGS
jgi:hypothetical protein